MFKYITIRLLLGIFALFIILVLTYLLIGSFGANPFALDNPQTAGEKFIAAGLNRPIFIRLGEWFARFFQGDFSEGYGLVFVGRTIPSIFFGPMLFTIGIATPAFIISTLLGTSLGVWSGYKRGTYVDAIINFLTRIFISLPAFVIAPFLILFGVAVGLPTIFASAVEGASTGEILLSSFLPVSVLIVGSLAAYVTYARNETVRVLNSNYILIAKSKGLKSSEIFFKYVLKNISIPLMSLIIPSFILIISGSLIIESFFKVPGTNVLFLRAFPNGEINIVMFSTFFFAVLTISSKLIVDIVSILLDPRIKIANKNPYGLWQQAKAFISRKKDYEKNILNLAKKNDSQVTENGAK